MSDAPQDVREKVESALNKALRALQSASRQLTEQHKIVLNGNQWGDTAITAVEAAIAALREAGWGPTAHLVQALRYYASNEAWTTQQVEGGDGDYGRRARMALAAAAPEPPA